MAGRMTYAEVGKSPPATRSTSSTDTTMGTFPTPSRQISVTEYIASEAARLGFNSDATAPLPKQPQPPADSSSNHQQSSHSSYLQDSSDESGPTVPDVASASITSHLGYRGACGMKGDVRWLPKIDPTFELSEAGAEGKDGRDIHDKKAFSTRYQEDITADVSNT